MTEPLDHSTRYDLMTSDQVPADEIAAWLKEPGFAAYVEGRKASMAARQESVNAPALSDAHGLIERCAQIAEGNSTAFDLQEALAEYRDYEAGSHSGRLAAAKDIRSLATIPAAEPVAWQQRLPSGKWGTILHGSDKPIGEARPLYASPQPARETEAIETAPHGGLWWREDFAQALAKLDGVTLQDVRSTVGPARDANSWRTYLGKADDLMAALAALRAGEQP